jgi:hypothetical protein
LSWKEKPQGRFLILSKSHADKSEGESRNAQFEVNEFETAQAPRRLKRESKFKWIKAIRGYGC